MKNIIAIGLLIAATASFPRTATAQAAPDTARLVSRMIAAEQAAATANGATLTVDGAPAIATEGGVEKVTLLHLTLATADGTRIDLGQPRAALVPAGTGSWKVGLIFPKPIHIAGADGTVTSYTLGHQDITLTWRDDFGGFTAAQAHCSGGSLTGAPASGGSGFSGALPDLTFTFALQPESGQWMGPFALTATSPSLTAGDMSNIKLASLSVRGNVAAYAAGAPRAGFASLRAHATLQGLHIGRSGTNVQPAQNLSLPAAAADLNLRDTGNGQDAAKLTAQYKDLVVAPLAGSALTIPSHLTLDADIAPLPAGGLLALAKQFLAAPVTGNGADAKAAKKSARDELLHMLEQAHSKITLRTLVFGNKLYSAQGNGIVTMSDTAPNGAVGNAHATANGLAALTQALNGAPPATMITVIQLVGQAAPTGDARDYNIVFSSSGPVLFNGQDVAGLLQGAKALSQFGVQVQ